MIINVVGGSIEGYMSVKEAADFWHTSKWTVYKAIERGEINTLVIGDAKMRGAHLHYIREGTPSPVKR